jgi:hypothetical protein
MWLRVGLVRRDVSEELVASIFRAENVSQQYEQSLIFVAASHGSLSSTPSRNLNNMTQDPRSKIFDDPPHL